MNGAVRAPYGHRFAQPEGGPGATCDDQGPLWNSVRLLVKTASGWAPRPADELDALLAAGTGRVAANADSLHSRLVPVARALNEGNLAQAVIGTQYLPLPPLPSLAKASPTDPLHPGWPAGEPDGRGGEFRPKEGGLSEADQAEVDIAEPKAQDTANMRAMVKTTARRAARNAFRKAAINLLTSRRMARIALELAGNAIPVVDVLADAALAADMVELAGQLTSLSSEIEAVYAYVNAGVHTTEELMVASEEVSFSSYDAFKKLEDLEKMYGPAGDGFEYHHIVEQSAIKDGIPVELVQSTKNIVRIPKLMHEEVSAVFNGPAYEGATISLREYLKTASFEERMRKGLEVMRKLGLVK
ncbi:hypothetical protein [Azospirillum sp. B4]|uniref:hypothetical protein n=1 Tax=Azospirillum sp. B4 TaxID=95605 RepID=UPI000346E803|nr:hypothetical protein [Azospirillum sp. B4]